MPATRQEMPDSGARDSQPQTPQLAESQSCAMTADSGIRTDRDANVPNCRRESVSSLSLSVAVGGILLLALLPRVWGLDYGLPHPMARPDEEQIARQALFILSTGNLHPGLPNYPGLFKYASALSVASTYYAGRLTGRYRDVAQFLRNWLRC
jgi:hypothetical protein